MSERTEGVKARYQELLRIAAAVVASAIIIINAANKVQQEMDAYRAGKMSVIDAMPAAALLVLTVMYGIAWYTAAEKEYGLFARYYGGVAPDRQITTILASIFVPTVLVLLAYFFDNIGVYSTIFCLYAAANLYVRSAVRRETRRMLQRAGKRVDDRISREFALLYIERPFQKLNLSLLIAGAFGIWAAYGRYGTIVFGAIEVPSKLLGYLIIGITLLFNEVVIWLWRRRFYMQTEV